ncbi:MAG TPA: sigma-70 family RNA polymerase sigma factor [Candidatus Obscuribacterales bacterium]
MNQRKQQLNLQFEPSTFCYMEQLFRLAYSRVGNTEDAEDIVQETYLKAFRAFDTVRHPARIKSWLTNILVNTIHDHRRKGRRTIIAVDIDSIEEETIIHLNQSSPEEELCRDEIDPNLCRAMQTVPDKFLIPLLLREIHEETYDAIAQILDIPIGTVMSRLFRARTLLRHALREPSK